MQGLTMRAGRWTLRKQVLFGMCLLTVTMSFTAARLVGHLEGRFLTQTVERYSSDVLKVIRSAALEAIITEDEPHLRSIGEDLLTRDLRITRVVFRNELGQPLVTVATDAAGAGGAVEPDSSDPPFIADINYLGETFGSVEIAWDLSDQINEIQRHSVFIAGVVAALLFSLTAAIYGGLTISVLRPLTTLDRQIRYFAEGDLDTRLQLPPSVARELFSLGQSVEELAKAVKANQRRTAQIEAAKTEAVRASRAKSDFLASMSHELRTPLNAILGFSEIIRSEILGPIENARYGVYADDIHRSGLHLLDLIRDILDLVKVEAGKLGLEESIVAVDRLVEECLRMAVETGRKRRLQVIQQIPAGIVLRGDERRLRQILLNLVSNALKFTDEGGRVEVSVVADDEGRLVMSVRDNGRGIAAADLSRVLEPFGQVRESVYETTDGTGLGLPISRKLAELHGAKFDLISAPGEGTEVRITFPAERVVRLGLPGGEPERPSPRLASPAKP